MGLKAFTRDEDRWAAVRGRDRAADGQFYYSVRTTGVYCRPSCAARPANRENVAFHESAEAAERAGFRPCKRCRPRARAEVIRFAVTRCSLGLALVAATELGVCAVLLGNDSEVLERDLRRRFPEAELLGPDARIEGWIANVLQLIERPTLVRMKLRASGGGSPDNSDAMPLDLRGTELQQRVWKALREIPAGETVGYAELARRVGSPTAVRAVAQACGANALAVVIPCHRVVRSDGSISGYRWGVERKRTLLEKERVAAMRAIDSARPALGSSSRGIGSTSPERSAPTTVASGARP